MSVRIMSSHFTTFFVLFLLTVSANVAYCEKDIEIVERVRKGMVQAMNWAQEPNMVNPNDRHDFEPVYRECVKLYQEAEPRLARLVSENCSYDDALTWLSSALASHQTCVDDLKENGLQFERAQNLASVIGEALTIYGAKSNQFMGNDKEVMTESSSLAGGLLASWNAATSKADFVVAQDGSGSYKTINEAVGALAQLAHNRPERVVVYVKSGIYHEKVEVGGALKNIMFVGDGIDKTIITGNLNRKDGLLTDQMTATFDVSGDGFWARDITFENTAGAVKEQAVALRVASDSSIFYRCSFKGYQDTLYTFSNRQFYRDCQIHGTVDFIYGFSSAVFQNCSIFVRKPMDNQSNTITAHGRDHPMNHTGISIIKSRVLPDDDFSDVKGMFKSYLGRPWRKYSRTVFMETHLDGLVAGEGWLKWDNNTDIASLYYAEYNNSGDGASTSNRVNWPGFHVLHDSGEASRFTVRNFIAGISWLPATGVPFSPDL